MPPNDRFVIRRALPPRLSIRPAVIADLADCAGVWQSSISDYMRHLNQPPAILVPEIMLPFLGHLLQTDPSRFLVAERSSPGPDGSRIVGFGSATQREHVWFLAMLFVEPSAQRVGVGRALLSRLLPRDAVPGAADRETPRPDGEPALAAESPRPGVLAVCTDSAQPISNALYARYGLVPRMPMLNLVGRPGRGVDLPVLPAGVAPLPFDGLAAHEAAALRDEVDAIDRLVLGYARRGDHDHFRRAGRLGYLYRGPDGEPLGYGYASALGRIGPVALLDPLLTAGVLTHLLTAVEPRGASSLWVPGANDRAMVALLRAGLRLESFPGLLGWTRPFGAFDRYLPYNLALL